MPVLTAHYRLARLPEPLSVLGHLDLLHPTRCAYGRYWPDCRLQTVEQRLLNFRRDDDLPGHLVPEVWTAFVRSGTFGHIPRILHHNLRDLVSLAVLLSTLANVYAEPGYARADTLSIARGLRRRGQDEQAYRHLRRRHEDLDPSGLMELADLHRRRRAWDNALEIWRRLAQEGHMMAMERLAKYHEHMGRDHRAALKWTERLLLRRTDEPRHRKRKARLLQRLGRVI